MSIDTGIKIADSGSLPETIITSQPSLRNAASEFLTTHFNSFMDFSSKYLTIAGGKIAECHNWAKRSEERRVGKECRL